MSRYTTNLLKTALSTIYFTGGHHLLAPYTQGVGVIFMLHQVTPEPPRKFEPNRILKITPAFLGRAIENVRKAGFDVVSLDEAHWRLCEGDFERSFACFTFDDGYRDNYEHAYPIFRDLELPFAIYVPSDFADLKADLWWLTLEHIIDVVDELRVRIDGADRTFAAASVEEKENAYDTIYWWLRGIDENDARAFVRQLARGIGFDPASLGPELLMDWDTIRIMDRDPLVTIGGHTKGHYAIAKLSEAEARFQVQSNLDRLEAELGHRPEHFSYPYGCEVSATPREFAMLKELGIKTAVTTRKGLIYAEHEQHLTALPRVSLNGDYQEERYLKVFLSGAPFILRNGFKKVNAA